MNKSDLKTGMVVEDRAGRRFLIVGEIKVGTIQWGRLSTIKEDLTSDRIPSCDIMMIFNPENAPFEEMIKTQNIIWEREPAIDWSKVKVDTKVLVSSDGEVWYKRYFAIFLNKHVRTFTSGGTSFTKDNSLNGTDMWGYAKLYKEGE